MRKEISPKIFKRDFLIIPVPVDFRSYFTEDLVSEVEYEGYTGTGIIVPL